MKQVSLRRFLIAVFVIGVTGVMLTRAYAGDDDCRGHSCNDGGTVAVDTSVTTGDLVGGENRSIAIAAPGLGDVDIAQCLGSEAWTLLVGGKQKLVLNQVCMAEFYLKQGRYDLAAQSLCNQPEILEEYGTESQCELAHDFTPAIPDHDVHSKSDEFEERYQEEVVVIQMAQVSLEDRVMALERKPAPRPRVAQAVEPEMTLEEKEAIMALLFADKDDEDE